MLADNANCGSAESIEEYRLLIDSREIDVLRYFSSCDFPFNAEQYCLGDFSIEINGKVLACVERKTEADMLSSFSDGRYKRGKERMIDARKETDIDLYWLLETPVNERMIEPRIRSALLHMMCRDKIFVLRTSDHADTAEMLKELTLSYARFHGTSNIRGGNEIIKVPIEHKPREMIRKIYKVLGVASRDVLFAEIFSYGFSLREMANKIHHSADIKLSADRRKRMDKVTHEALFTEEVLKCIHGIGPKKAQKIIENNEESQQVSEIFDFKFVAAEN